jgi:hypothetical protein
LRNVRREVQIGADISTLYAREKDYLSCLHPFLPYPLLCQKLGILLSFPTVQMHRFQRVKDCDNAAAEVSAEHALQYMTPTTKHYYSTAKTIIGTLK